MNHKKWNNAPMDTAHEIKKETLDGIGASENKLPPLGGHGANEQTRAVSIESLFFSCFAKSTPPPPGTSTSRREGEEDFYNHCKNDPERHAHTLSGDAGAIGEVMAELTPRTRMRSLQGHDGHTPVHASIPVQ